MCGIAGIINHRSSPDAPGIVEAMNQVQAHRGPDGSGLFKDRDVVLGHRRLAVIDLATGDQPLSNEDETVTVIFNGEIYNYQKLRNDLEERGHHFKTQSDTEVIVHLYEELGGECTSLLDGMFSFAVYNSQTRRVLLGRDRTGQKPLYYFMQNGMLVFASELAALKCHPAMPRELDPAAVSDYLSFQYVPGPGTIFRNVFKLAPGHQLEFRINEGTVSIRSYRRLDYSLKQSSSFEESSRELRRLVEKAVTKRLISDVPLGAFLSGGVDSTIITALAARQRAPERTLAFTIGFDDDRYDERSFAARAADSINTATGNALRHKMAIVDPGDFSVVEKLAEICEEPYADASILPTFLLSRFARHDVKVALSGDGADEVFCGYERYLAMRYASRMDALPEAMRKTLLESLSRMFPDRGERTFSGRTRRFLRVAAAPAGRRYFEMLNRCPAKTKALLFGDRLRDALRRDSAEYFNSLTWELSSFNKTEQLSELDFHTYLPGDILFKVDMASMATGLEVRSPFLDREVIDFATHLPLSYKLDGSSRKHILLEAFKDLLPPAIRNRPKKGFGVPVAAYLRGEWHNLAEEALFDSSLTRNGFFDGPQLRKLWQEHQSGRRDHSYLLWSLLLFALFLQRNHL